MTYRRIIKHLDTDATTVKSTLSSIDIADPRAVEAWFELLRLGGCGAGELVLKDKFTLRGTIDVGDHIAFEYDTGDRWYLGRVESVQEESPSGVRVSLFGLWATLAEVYPGGFAEGNLDQPHRYARSDWFSMDPDHAFQTHDNVSQPDSMLNLLFSQYISPATNITLGTVNTATLPNGLDSFIFRGEESAQEILRMLALYTRDASVGVNADGELFFTPISTTLLDTFQEGVDCEALARSRSRKLFYNRLLLTGGYVYITGTPGFFRWRGEFRYSPSVATYGEKVAQIFVPWIRRNQDATTFAKEFFGKYGEPPTRVTLTTTPQTALRQPWDGEIEVQDRDGTVILRDRFEKIKVYFNQKPYFEIELGPEDLQFPPAPEDQRFEAPRPSAMPFDPPGVFTGFSDSGEFSETIEFTLSDCPIICKQPHGYDFRNDGGVVWEPDYAGEMHQIDGSFGRAIITELSPTAMAIDFRQFLFNMPPNQTLGVSVEVHGYVENDVGVQVKVGLIGPGLVDNPVMLPAKAYPLVAGNHVDFGGPYAGGESWKMETRLDSVFVNSSVFGVRVKIISPELIDPGFAETVFLDSVKICISRDCFASSASQADTPIPDPLCLVDGIDGVEFAELDIEENGDVAYVLGINAAGCLVRVPVDECPSSS